MEKEIKKILKKHSVFQDHDNGFRVWRLYKDKWSDVAKDIESLVKKSNDIHNVSNCDLNNENNVRLSFLQEVWQAWCESDKTVDFDKWLHDQMHGA